ncbi:MAG: sugar phosphate isomerase/epimerase [Tannerellaceae bacterium]|jgi:sugar phosphate isomerase/epimerase|nr:sugar phosphate isomerase/epimerase [Tannerellaceae bacterium]
MQNRRDFLKQASFLLAGSIAVPSVLSSCGGGKAATAKKNIGLQLYSLREMVKDDGIQKVVETVGKMGYKTVELAGYADGKLYNMAPTEFKKLLDDNGLRCTSSHLSTSYTKETEAEAFLYWDKAIEAHNVLGAKYLIQPWLTVGEATPMDELKMYCDYFSLVGQKTAAASIAFGYHNHAHEFQKIDGKPILDIMLDTVSANHVLFELDVYWCIKGGADPVAYLKERSSQIRVIHIKDEKEIGASGEINFQPIFEQMKANNIKDWYVEVEKYTNNNPVESVQQSYDYLAAADYVY